MISKIKVNGQVFENPRLVGFGGFDGGDGFLVVFETNGRKYAISLSGKVYPVIERGTRLFIEIPYGERVYRAPLQFKL